MMTYYRHVYHNAPAAVPLPPELHDRRVEVIVLTIDEAAPNGKQTGLDARGWPVEFFAETFGSVPDHPERAPQGEYDVRESIE